MFSPTHFCCPSITCSQSNLMHEMPRSVLLCSRFRRVGEPHEIAPSLLSRLFALESLCATENGLFVSLQVFFVCLRSSSAMLPGRMHLYDHVEVHMQASRCFSEGKRWWCAKGGRPFLLLLKERGDRGSTLLEIL